MTRLTSSARRYPLRFALLSFAVLAIVAGLSFFLSPIGRRLIAGPCRCCAADRGYRGASGGAFGPESLFRPARYPGARR